MAVCAHSRSCPARFPRDSLPRDQQKRPPPPPPRAVRGTRRGTHDACRIHLCSALPQVCVWVPLCPMHRGEVRAGPEYSPPNPCVHDSACGDWSWSSQCMTTSWLCGRQLPREGEPERTYRADLGPERHCGTLTHLALLTFGLFVMPEFSNKYRNKHRQNRPG